MPLLDHFHPPLSRTHPWRAFHGTWAAAIARLLNGGILPAGYYAVPFLDRDGPIEIDVAALRESEAILQAADNPSWVPPVPGLMLAVEWPVGDDIKVEILTDEGDPELAAAIELVSPGNKDRPQSRAGFSAKCADYLRRGCGLVVVDVVTTRRADLRADLLTVLGAIPVSEAFTPPSAISYQSVVSNGNGQLRAWPTPLELGRPLPTIPLWLGPNLVVPLDLEAGYKAACADLRIGYAG